MSRKTFISYKYSETQGLRDKILEELGDGATYYQGETADSPNLINTSTDNIKKNLTDKMYDTSVTIVIISPKMNKSNWIDWEIEYSLKEIARKGRTSKTNGIVGVIQKVDGGYNWLVTMNKENDGCDVRSVDGDKLYDIIKSNRYNRKKTVYACDTCRSVYELNGSYISLIDEDDFLLNPDKYIENAFEKSEEADSFDLTKQR